MKRMKKMKYAGVLLAGALMFWYVGDAAAVVGGGAMRPFGHSALLPVAFTANAMSATVASGILYVPSVGGTPGGGGSVLAADGTWVSTSAGAAAADGLTSVRARGAGVVDASSASAGCFGAGLIRQCF